MKSYHHKIMKIMKMRNIYILGGLVLLVIGFSIFTGSDESEMETKSLKSKSAEAENEIAKIKRESREKREAWEAKREIERAEAERIEAERLAKWKARFPYKPTYHPTMKANPNIYHPSGTKANGEDVTNDDMRLLGTFVFKHGFLKNFFENPLIYSRQFEEIHDILAEYGRAGNPYITGHIFQHARDYHFTKQFDPDTLWHRPDISTGEYNPQTGEREYKPKPVDGKTTWGDRVELMKGSVIAALTWPMNWSGKTPPAQIEEALEIRDRILTEVEDMDMVEGKSFCFDGGYEEELQEGDPILIPYEGFVEEYRAYQKETYNWEPPPGHP